MKKIIACLIMMMFIVIGCNSMITGNSVEDNKIKIGIMTMTTGNLAFLGDNVVKSAELAVDSLGLNNKVEIVVEDVGYLGSGRTTLSAYRKLVDVDKVEIIIDGMTSDGTMAIAPSIDKDKVVMITPLTGGENVDNAAEYLFRNGPSDIIAGTKPAYDLFYKFGLKNIALFTDNAEYTLDISKHFRNSFNGKIVVDEIIIPDQTDYRTELSKINENVDAIVINSASGVSGAYLIKQLYELGNTKPIFGNFLVYNENTLAVAGNGAENVYIYDPEFEESELTQNFFIKYEEKYKHSPTIQFHTTGTFDAVKMFVEAVDQVGYDGEKVHDYLLENINEWRGMNGVVSFDEKGNTETGFVLKQVKDGMLVVVG